MAAALMVVTILVAAMLVVIATLAAARVPANGSGHGRQQHGLWSAFGRMPAPTPGPSRASSAQASAHRHRPAKHGGAPNGRHAKRHRAAPRHHAPWLPGVDVSNWNHVVKWNRVRASGQRFAIMKATEGRHWVDPKYARFRRRALRAGLVVAAYHFARPDRHRHDARLEADHFLRVAQIRAGDIIPVLDLETNGDLSRRRLIRWTWAWLNEVRRRTGVRSMIYTGSVRWRTEMRNTERFARAGYPLWLASWTRRSPRAPAHNWAGHGWTFWQHGACGRVPGIRKCVDVDRFRGRDLESVRVPTGLADTDIERPSGSVGKHRRCGPNCLLKVLRRQRP